MSVPEVLEERIGYLVDQANDILSSGQGEEVPNWYHEEAIPKLWIEANATPEEKAEVFKIMYTNPEGFCTIQELQWMMSQCGVKEFTFTLTADEE